MKRIAVLTSGGDSPGMNAAIRAVVRYGISKGLEVYGVYKGFCGLIDGELRKLEFKDVSGIMEKGGTILRTSRCEEFKISDGRKKALERLEEYSLEGLIVIGGEGSLTGASLLHSEFGFPVVGIPATIDNDIGETDMCIGVDTCLNTVVDAIQKLKDTAASHERAFIVEVMGRRSGYIALMAGLATGAEAVIIPELPVDYESIADRILEQRKRGKINSIIVVAEGASNAYSVARHLEHRIGYETRITILGHVQRGGTPTVFDRLLGLRMGARAVDALLEGKAGIMICLKEGKITEVPLMEALKREKKVDPNLYELAKILS